MVSGKLPTTISKLMDRSLPILLRSRTNWVMAVPCRMNTASGGNAVITFGPGIANNIPADPFSRRRP